MYVAEYLVLPLLTRVSSRHLKVMPCSAATAWARPRDRNANALKNLVAIPVQVMRSHFFLGNLLYSIRVQYSCTGHKKRKKKKIPSYMYLYCTVPR